ncbi:xylose isomerase [Thermogemmatispora aurantia]|uniref:sugar phosphate isomerase/epimerase family protein n=1 Tax=Thermogemmatispora aurantia TaxID=2045279 RepID=UPI001280ABED|nr:TIM barrel protein [Thermogemmatispora aurantia]GER85468.1 xylose isomerase [Thermogemmatispora aurantia]
MEHQAIKNSVGIWAFGPNVTRFVPPGYHPEVANEDMVTRTKRVVDGLADLVDGLEYHYPGEINEDTVEAIKAALGPMDIYCIAAGLHTDPTYKLGAFINPDPALRRRGIETLKRGVDLAAALGANFIIWPGAEGYNYNFQRDYAHTWNLFVEGVAEVVAHAASKGVKVFLEHKNSEPAMNILMRNIAACLYTIERIGRLGVDTSRLLVNMDWQHLIMNGENLAEYAALLHAEGRLGHQHANSGWGTFDDDNMVGASFFMQTLELAMTLQDVGYGQHGERIGYDLYPYTEDQIAAVRRSVLQWTFIDDLARKIDRQALAEARARADAVEGYRIVYETLGLDQAYIDGIIQQRKKR